MMVGTKKRGCNYTTAEKGILLDLVKKYHNIIENKKINSSIIWKKREAWSLVCQQFNAVAISGTRTWQQLRHLYENLKQRSKKNVQRRPNVHAQENHLHKITRDMKKRVFIEKKEINCSCGGYNKSTLSDQDAQILAKAAPHIKPLSNCYDDAALHIGDTELKSDIRESYFEVIPASELETINAKDDIAMPPIKIEVDTTSCTSRNTDDDIAMPPIKIEVDTTSCTSRNTDDDIAYPVKIEDDTTNCTSRNIDEQLKPCDTKEQYFKTKLRNARLESKYLINRNKREMNLYKAQMHYWKLKVQKLKS